MLMFTIVYLYFKAVILHYKSITYGWKKCFQNVKSHIDHNLVKMSYTLVFSRALYIAAFFSVVGFSLGEEFILLK